VVAYARKTGGRTALVGRRAGVASGIAALTMLALSADRKFEPRLYHYDEWLARQTARLGASRPGRTIPDSH